MKARQHQTKLKARGRLGLWATTALATSVGLLGVFAQHGSAQTPRLTTIYSFTGGDDGSSPNSLLAVKNGLIYGTTLGGGSGSGGTVFELKQPTSAGGTWTETPLQFHGRSGRIRP